MDRPSYATAKSSGAPPKAPASRCRPSCNVSGTVDTLAMLCFIQLWTACSLPRGRPSGRSDGGRWGSYRVNPHVTASLGQAPSAADASLFSAPGYIMVKMAVTMKDIARELRLSVVTVSKVIRNHSDIGEETRQRVLKRIKELNYQPNMAARALVTGRTYSAGLIVPDLMHPFFAEVATGLSDVLRRKNYSLLISSSQGDPDLERQEIKRLLSRRLDALMIASTQWTVESFRRIEEQKVPYVLIDRAFLGMPANFVGVDDIAVGRLATEHLISVGCLKIAHIRGPATSTALGRMEGYHQALAHHDLSQFQGYVLAGRSADVDSWISGHEAMKKLLARAAQVGRAH